MRHRLLSDGLPLTYVIAFDRGDEVVEGLASFAADLNVASAYFAGIGAFSEATLAFFNLESREYDEIAIDEQVEVLNITGNLTRFEGEPRVHVHAVLSRPEGTTIGGHLIRGVVQPTLEVFMTVLTGRVDRTEDPATGLPLMDL